MNNLLELAAAFLAADYDTVNAIMLPAGDAQGICLLAAGIGLLIAGALTSGGD